jgi:site-specific recombinase XerD
MFCEFVKKKKADRINLTDISRDLIVEYLSWLEDKRKCCISTRNQRLAAFRSFFHYVINTAPEMLLVCQQIFSIPMKKQGKKLISYFTPECMHLLLQQPNTAITQGRRDHALLVLLYDSAARVQEIVDLKVRDLRFEEPPTVTLHGKGRKVRNVPLSNRTASVLKQYLLERNRLNDNSKLDFPVFMNSQNLKLSRAGVTHILKKYVDAARKQKKIQMPQNISPHSLRHSKAVHLLKSGVPLIYIRDILGHVSVTTTEIYAKVDAEETRKALEKVYEIKTQEVKNNWKANKGLMAWLNNLCHD